MFKLFEWYPDIAARVGDNKYFEYYKDFLIESGICGTVFLWAMIITVVLLLLFYLVGCRLWHKVANSFVWLGVLAVTCVLTFTTTYSLVLGNDSKTDPTGVYLSALADKDALGNTTGTLKRLQGNIDNLTEEASRELKNTCEAYLEQFSTGEETLPYEMAFICTIYSFIVFVAGSLLVRRFSIHGRGIPRIPFL